MSNNCSKTQFFYKQLVNVETKKTPGSLFMLLHDSGSDKATGSVEEVERSGSICDQSWLQTKGLQHGQLKIRVVSLWRKNPDGCQLLNF